VNEQPASLLTRPHLFAAFFFVIFTFLLYRTAILAIALAPLNRRVVLAVKEKKALAAGIMTVGTLLIVRASLPAPW
jgi:hypothetical protein